MALKLHPEDPTSEATITSTSSKWLTKVKEGSATQVNPLLFYNMK